MKDTSFSRRNFLTTLASTAAAVTLPNSAPAFMPGGSTLPVDIEKRRSNAGPIKILCTQNLSQQEIEHIRAAGKNINLVMTKDPGEIKSQVGDAEVVLGTLDGNLVSAARNLKWVQTFAAGVENMPKELREHPCTLTNMQRVYAPVIAESAIALLLSLTRGLAQVSIPAFANHKCAQH